MLRLAWNAAPLAVLVFLAVPLPALAQDTESPAPSVSPSEQPAWSLHLSAGFGLGSRDLDLPMDGVLYRVRTGLFPAADLAFRLDGALTDSATVGLHVRYQTSIGHRVVEQHTDGSERPQALRSHRLSLALVPTFSLDDRGRWSLSGSVGFGLCDLRPLEHLVTPAYELAGPHAGLQLRLPVGLDPVRLRIAPEALWIVHVGQDLVDRGVATEGYGAGGEIAIEVILGRGWRVDATYRELRSWLDTSQGSNALDIARFATARLTGVL